MSKFSLAASESERGLEIPMSDHIWVTEHLATYVADGLDAAERQRVEQHIAECATCAQAVAEFSSLDTHMENLFAGERPTPALEDRMIRMLRLSHPRKSWTIALRFAASFAALLMLGVVGAVGSSMLAEGKLTFPGASTFHSLMPPSLETDAEGQLADVFDSSGSMGWRSVVERGPKNGFGPFQRPAVGVEGQLGGPLSDPNSDVSSAGSSLGPPPMDFVNTDGKDEAARKFEAGEKRLKEMREDYLKKDPLYKGGGLERGGATAHPDYRAALLQIENKRKEVEQLKSQQTYGYPALRGAPTNRKLPDLPWNLPDPKSSLVPEPSSNAVLKIQTPEEGRAAKDLLQRMEPNQPISPAKPMPPKEGEAKSPPQGEKPNTPPAEVGRRVIIRSGDIEFEITSFDDAVGTITQLVGGDKGGFVATVNSEKLPNGKVRGSVVVRIPPDKLDALVLELRKELGKTGELKSQRIGSQDITKQFTDFESRLRAARAMEERLLKIIKDGKGEIKDLVAAEKELGNWRTKIEEFEGEIRYFSNLVSLSTLTITLYEKEMRAAASIKEIEKVDMGIEVEDVEKAHRDALAAITAAKGRVSKAELKQQGAGQFNATIHFEADPEAAGPLRDRLKQLGNVARLQIDRIRQPEGGTGKPSDGKVERVDTHFIVAIYNLTGLVPREVVNIKIVTPDAESAYKTALARAGKATGRIVTSNLNRQRSDQTNGTIQFEVKSSEADAVLADLRALGEVMLLQVKENPDGPNVTRAKQGFLFEVWSLAMVQLRETINVSVAMSDVPKGFRTLQEAISKTNGRIINAQLSEQEGSEVTAHLDFEVRRAEEDTIRTAVEAAGAVHSRNVARAADGENVIDSKVRWIVTLFNVRSISPTETVKLGIEVKEVEQTAAALSAYVHESKGRIVDSSLTHEPSGRIKAIQIYDVPLKAAPGVIEKIKATGVVRQQQVQRNPQERETELATARLHVELTNEAPIVPKDEGIWAQVRKGLATSAAAISWSVVVVIIGLCFVLPWALVLYAGYLLVRRLRRGSQTA